MSGDPGQTGMPCPRCQVELVMSERQGIEIDYCPKCRGVWLDRGELDKIIERSSQFSAPPEQPPQQPSAWIAPLQAATTPPPAQPVYGHGAGHGGSYGSHGSHGGKRRKGWLGELFD